MRMTEAVFTERRAFIRHPASIPVASRRRGHSESTPKDLCDMSFGGMSFISATPHSKGDVVEIRFPSLRNVPAIRGEVVWTHPLPDGDKRVVEGVRFLNEQDHFRARMIEQICYMLIYMRDQQAAGRTLTAEQAAEEWAGKFASVFPE